MTRNMGALDRTLRLVAAFGLIVLAFATDVAGAGAPHWLALAAAAVLALTALLGFCPLYTLLGVRTCRTG